MSDHQLGVDRGSPEFAVERAQVRPQARQVDNAVDRAEKMIGWNVPLQAELVEQRLLRHPPLAHHPAASVPRTTESGLHAHSNDAFFNDIRQQRKLACCPKADPPS